MGAPVRTTTLPIGTQKNKMMHCARAFTLVELVLVMALLCVILGIAAPSLSNSFHQRNLKQEATRLLAVTEYARDEAISQGVPMVVWIDPAAGYFGARAKTGYESSGARPKQFKLMDGLHFETAKNAAPTTGTNAAVEYEPDGTLDASSQLFFDLADQSNSSIEVARTTDATGYEIVLNDPQLMKGSIR